MALDAQSGAVRWDTVVADNQTMKRDEDGMPAVESSASGLGVRPGIDVDVDERKNVLVNGKGMSVSPAWRTLPVWRIPKRLKDKVPGARGSASTFCFKAGAGAFERGNFADGLELIPDSPTHGTIAPTATVMLTQYQSDLASTRAHWEIDEN